MWPSFEEYQTCAPAITKRSLCIFVYDGVMEGGVAGLKPISSQ
jgi:hypothetical protein